MKRTGRPPLDENDPSVGVSLKLPGKQDDRLWHRAQRERCTVPEIVRRELAAADRRRQDEPDEK